MERKSSVRTERKKETIIPMKNRRTSVRHFCRQRKVEVIGEEEKERGEGERKAGEG